MRERQNAVCERYERLYTGAVADILDKNGYRNQVLPAAICAFTQVKRVCGWAFTGQGAACPDVRQDDTQTRLAMLDSIPPDSVSVWACGSSTDCAHWGEMMSTAARQRGGKGAVIDGGVRDLDFIDTMQYPVFARFKCAASSIGRWSICEYQLPVRIGETTVCPGDLVFGDVDGVVVVPHAIALDVLEMAEDIYQREARMRDELREGANIKDAYSRYGSL